MDNKELLDLYFECGRSTPAVSRKLAEQGVTLSERTIRYRLASKFPGYNTTKFDRNNPQTPKEVIKDQRPVAGGVLQSPDKRRLKLEGKRFVFTCAQNNTHIHEDFFSSLMQYCMHNDAQLIVSRFTYNKHGFQNATKEDGSDQLWFDHRLQEFFLDESAEVCPGLIFCGELDILPTAGLPLSGLGNYCMNSSGIVPHAKMQMESLPRMKGEDARFLYTTGAITLRNYIQRKAGQKAEFHHVFGAVVVEIDDDGDWFVRQLVADESGCFYDLTFKYTPDGAEPIGGVEAVNWGDIHIEKMDSDVYVQAWASPYSMLNVLNPKYQFVHDLTDFSARNHHNIKDPFFLAEMYHTKKEIVAANLMTSAAFLAYITSKGHMAIVVESNHDQAYRRWLKEADIRIDPANAEFFHKSNAELHKQIRRGNSQFNIYEWALREMATLPQVRFLNEDDSFIIGRQDETDLGGIECGMHGHRGPNGARGTSRAFRNIGRKCNLGHSHSAGIIDGVYTAGVSGSLDMGYNKGPSSWSHSHIITYANGKRAIVSLRNGKWRA